MDKKTEDYRRRQKALDRGRKPGESGMSGYLGAKAIGRKNKPSERVENKRCSEIVGGQEAYFKKRRPDGTEYSVRYIKGGVRCSRSEFVKGLCREHLEERRGRMKKTGDRARAKSPKRTHIVGRDGKEV